MNSSYVQIGNFGANSNPRPHGNPLSICAVPGLQAGFNNVLGSSFLNPQGSQCQLFMANYCGEEWTSTCEYLSYNDNKTYPNTLVNCNFPTGGSCQGSGIGNVFTGGEILIRNSAYYKYLDAMSSNCGMEYVPFDPTNASSPLMGRWKSSDCNGKPCIPMFKVDPKTIDNDPLMDRILKKPIIAIDILINIYRTMSRSRQIQQLKNTKLGRFFESELFQQYLANTSNRN